jgi:outer membrane protein OmpA-like peptidoglycan-associated protein
LTKPTQSGEPASLAFSSDAILFGYGSAKLLDKSIPQLQEIAKALKDPVLAVIPFFFVDGHTCSIGTDANNCQLSRDRAASVVKFLIEKGGVPKAKLKARGFGEREPMVSNDTEANRKKNRRVVLKSGLLELKKDKEKQCAAGKE